MTDFIDVYVVATGAKQRVPRHFLGDPVLGLGIRKTPQQRAYDGDLPDLPPADAPRKDLQAYADAAGIDTKGLNTVQLLTAVQDLEHADPLLVGDPVAEVPGDDDTSPAGTPADGTTTNPGDEPAETPATGAGQENQ